MTVQQVLDRLLLYPRDAQVTVLRPRKRKSRLEDPEQEALDVLGITRGVRSSVMHTFTNDGSAGELVVAIKTR